MKLVLIVATDLDGAIGNSVTNDIPWHISADLKRFKKLTTGFPVIMGFNTFASLPRGPLANRTNIIVTSKPDAVKEICEKFNSAVTVVTFPTLKEAIEYCKALQVTQSFIIGGARIYEEAMNNHKVDIIHRTLVKINSGADIFFPKMDREEWDLSWMSGSEENGIRYTFMRYDKVIF